MEYYTIKQAAEVGDINPVYLRLLIRQGVIKATKFGQRAWLLDAEAINQLLSRSDRRRKEYRDAK